MAFTSGGGPVCRETVPGGSLLAIAYAIVLLVLGAYVAMLARRNARLATQIADLEREIARRRGGAGDNGS
jgi:CcmD family protein